MKRSLALTLALTALWALASVWYYDCKIKRVCGPDQPADIPAATASDPGPKAVIAAPAATPAAVPATPAAAVVEKPQLTVRFAKKSSEIELPPDADQTLVALQRAVARGQRLLVTGHSDNRGERRRIAIVSAERAEALRAWLILKGIAPEAFAKVESREDREPIADNSTAEGRALNRRAVVTLATAE